jgi:hypothetical protein
MIPRRVSQLRVAAAMLLRDQQAVAILPNATSGVASHNNINRHCRNVLPLRSEMRNRLRRSFSAMPRTEAD